MFAVLAAGTTGAEQTYSIDKSHASLGFAVKHLVISKVRGEFRDFDGTLTLGDENALVSATAAIRAASIDTGNKDRDDHLRTPDFFAVANYPEITFASKSTEQRGGKDVLVGDLTLHGVTKEVALEYSLSGPITDPWGNTKIGFEASTVIDRTQFGLTWNKALETGGLVVGTDVEISINFEAALEK
ncbi:MAG: YceI family protein [Verrucomicrobia bacterium]|nr:YceI family protein [Verrucomicrobiota bacterium]